MNKTREIGTMLVAGLLCFSASSVLFAGDRAPNVLIVIADDMGWGDLSGHGNESVRTPNLDRLASAGASFERFYVQPVCSPTRAEVLTGLHHPRVGVSGVSRGFERMQPAVKTLGDVFKQQGYSTAAFGKWHNGTQAPYHPKCRGFDEFYGFCSGHWGQYFAPLVDHNGRIEKSNGYLTDELTTHAIDFMRKHKSDPFFILLAYNTPHSPMQVPDRWWQPHAHQQLAQRGTNQSGENIQHTRAALAMCENIDWNVGRLTDAIDAEGLQEDTIVVILSDNGPNGHRWNGEMRGIKGTTDEGGVRSPLFIKWPGRIPAGQVVSPNAAAIDLLPTLCELAEADSPKADGVSLAPLVQGQSTDWPERFVYSHWNGKVSARRGHLVLDHAGRLYDLKQDPGQQQDIADQQPDVAQEFRAAVDTWRREVLDESARSPQPFTVGHRSLQVTQLPARDATATGGIERSSRHPNSSFMTNWTNADETIDWKVDVAESGRFGATLYYSCDASDAGSEVELRSGNSTVSCKVPAHPSELIGAESDRVLRTESYEQDWKALEMGTIDLAQGEGTLTLRALDVVGDEVMDFRLLVLRRIDD